MRKDHAPRSASRRRETSETRIALDLDLDGSGQSEVETHLPFFDHMLHLFARHALLDLKLRAEGDTEVDSHHTVEDTGIVLGEALREALGEKTGIRRYGLAYVPMDETLARAVIDLSDRPVLEFRAPAGCPDAQNFPFTLLEEFFRALASNLRCNLHLEVLYGRDGHHIAEALFKATARALRAAAEPDPRVTGVPSTKGTL